MRNRFVALAAVAVLALGACGNGGATKAPATAGPVATSGPVVTTAAACKIGVSWNNYQQERWKKADEPNIKKAVEAAGGTYTSTDARDNSEQQLTDIDTLINQGVSAIILLAKDGTAILPAVTKAQAAGIPVIGYDRLIENKDVFYISFNNKLVGQLEAEAILKLVPEGNYAVIKGDPGDANAAFLRAGMDDGGLKAAVDAGKVKIVYEQNTNNWDTTNAKNNMEAALNSTTPVNDIQAVLSENDSMAIGVVAALDQVGIVIPVSGQDGDAANLNHVAQGKQAVDVWKNANALGETAGAVAIQLCHAMGGADVKAPSDLPAGAAPADLDSHVFTTPGGNSVNSIILTPTPITKDNLSVPIDAGWVTKEVVCNGVTAGSVAPC